MELAPLELLGDMDGGYIYILISNSIYDQYVRRFVSIIVYRHRFIAKLYSYVYGYGYGYVCLCVCMPHFFTNVSLLSYLEYSRIHNLIYYKYILLLYTGGDRRCFWGVALSGQFREAE